MRSIPLNDKSLLSIVLIAIALCSASANPISVDEVKKLPNILLCLSDDQSYPHTSAYGDTVVKTPVFDRVAREGVLFTHAYCASPSCTASRSAILTGQDIWRLGQGGQLFGTLAATDRAYTDILIKKGYHVGFMDKGWAPGSVDAGGRSINPAGMKYKSFEEFMSKAPAGKPWCFWFGSRDPHRGYKKGSGISSGMNPAEVQVPAIFPDTQEVRSDICDYYFEIQRFDQEVGKILGHIKKAGQSENTLVVITSDNGMPFPRAKANLYDLGTRMPLAISWPKRAPGGRTVHDFVNLTDLAATFVEAAGITPPKEMTGRSLVSLLSSSKSGQIEAGRDAVVTARERHAWSRINGTSYPMRMIRTKEYLYIRNYDPDRWPAGDYRVITNEGHYGDIDASPTKNEMMILQTVKPRLFRLAFAKRPIEELYDCRKDPDQVHNLAADPAYKATLNKLSERLTAYLKATGDPRETSAEILWDTLPYFGAKRWEIVPEKSE